MTKHERIIASLKPAELSALHSAKGSYVGAPCEVTSEVRTALVDFGLIAGNDGLTVVGANVRATYMIQLEEEMFPL
jgi:hypothetical protein